MVFFKTAGASPRFADITTQRTEARGDAPRGQALPDSAFSYQQCTIEPIVKYRSRLFHPSLEAVKMVIPIDPTRFLKSPVSPADPLRPQDISNFLDAETGYVYNLVSYPNRPESTFLTIDGGNGQKINVKGNAAREIWDELSSPNPRRYLQLSNSVEFADQKQFFDLGGVVLYLYKPGGRLMIVRPTGGSEVTIMAQAEALWNALCELSNTQ